MAQLRREADTLAAHDTEVLITGPEKPDAFKRFWTDNAMPFTALPDPDHTLATLFGQEVKILKLGRLPSQMLIRQDGILAYAYYGDTMADIPSVSDIIEALNEQT